MEIKKRISISNARADEIAQQYGCTRTTVHNALQYRFEGKKAKWIRHAAVLLPDTEYVLTLTDYDAWNEAEEWLKQRISKKQ